MDEGKTGTENIKTHQNFKIHAGESTRAPQANDPGGSIALEDLTLA